MDLKSNIASIQTFSFCAHVDNMKDAIVAKLACQCEELYAETLRGLQKDSVKSVWDKEWIPTVSGWIEALVMMKC